MVWIDRYKIVGNDNIPEFIEEYKRLLKLKERIKKVQKLKDNINEIAN
jgi:hypothetical protein